jgi:alkanesulfonate monooxygenase SsuD/methylene tetrahydromethanopterin reductase-like flavin-dependent oxidoreductase (luciferase family)
LLVDSQSWHRAARTNRLILSTATTLITTNDPVKIAKDYAMLQHLAVRRNPCREP